MQTITNIQEIETAVNQFGEIVISKQEDNTIMMMNMEEYNRERMKKDMAEELKKAEEEIARGEVIPAETMFKELRQKYGY